MRKRIVALMTAAWLTAAITAASGHQSQAGQAEAEPEKGEQILNRSCTNCHDSRSIDMQALDRDGWSKEVNSMIGMGADVQMDEVPVLVDFLARKHGPLPEGPGKAILLDVCTMCHDLDRVRRPGQTPEEWQGTLEAMLNEGAPLTEQDFPVLLLYLAKNFKP